jgi:hypothetical protein
MKKYLTLNNLLRVIASIVGVAGVIVAAPVAAVPAVAIAIATHVLTYGTVAGLIAAKILPGHGANAPDAIKPAPTP